MCSFVVPFSVNLFFGCDMSENENGGVAVMYVIQDLSLAYGEDMIQNGRCLEAGLILSRAGKCERALTAFEDCLEWRHAVTVASRLNFSDLQLSVLAKRLASKSLNVTSVLVYFHCRLTKIWHILGHFSKAFGRETH